MTHNVAIIGAGQLGSRHLQGLANCSTPLAIHLVDPSPASLVLARERFTMVSTSEQHTLDTAEEIQSLPPDLDLAIVACTADCRFGVYQDLLTHTRARVILLEKVLFQDLDQYPQAIALGATSKTRTIVNLAQRYWPFFRQLRDEVVDKSQLSVTITGSNWGLGCNAVHNVDIAEYLWGGAGVTTARLDPYLRESKRANCHEFTGVIETLMPSGGRLIQMSYSDGEAPFMIAAQTPEFLWLWDVSNGKCRRADARSNWKFVESDLAAPFQSNLTTRLIDDILAGQETDLPDLPAASATHIATLSQILENCLANGHDFGRVCPVT